ncbi:MAG: hypothetical protein R3C10_22250 [Pirellulales bacterium]
MAWTNDDLSSYLSSLIIRDGYVYGMNDGGEFVCIAVADGKTVWFNGSHGFYSTPLRADERLLALNERGTLLQLAATPRRYDLTGQWQLTDEATWTVPAVAERTLLVRSADALTCFSLAP